MEREGDPWRETLLLELHASRRYTFNAGRRILRMSIGDDAVIGFAIRSLQSLVAIRSQIRPEYDSPQLASFRRQQPSIRSEEAAERDP